MKKMIVIGGGAAGMMAAIYASDNYEVTLLEKNDKLGKKLFITGKGRCNITNECDIDTFLKNVVSNSKFMMSPINVFDCDRTKDTFQKMGLDIKTERGNRVFPASDHSSDVISVLKKKLSEKNVKICINQEVSEICTEDYSDVDEKSKYIKKVTGVFSSGKFIPADVIIVATGGKSYPLTGSTGDGYKFAEKLGIKIISPYPALVPVIIEEEFCKEMMGLSLRNIKATFTANKNPDFGLKKDKIIYSDFGEMLFTHFGVSGPVILSASSYLHKYADCEVTLSLDLKPALTREQLNDRILRDFSKYMNKQFRNSLDDLLPKKLITYVIEKTGIDEFKKVNEITHEERMKLIDVLKDFKMKVKGLRGFDEAIITGGGVSVKEINPKTMETKTIKGLKFAGEVLDVDALTGGFNLQVAWCTGFVAGNSL